MCYLEPGSVNIGGARMQLIYWSMAAICCLDGTTLVRVSAESPPDN